MSDTRTGEAGTLTAIYGSDATHDAQRDAFRQGRVPVAVYGLGKMGLPLAAVYADVCGNVTGVDVDPDVVETVAAGDCHVGGEPGLPELVADVVDAGALSATTDAASAAAGATVHVVIVPTLLTADNDPDLSAVESVLEGVAEGLDPGDLVVVESTVPPGTCETVVRPTLARESGLALDAFGVAFCPERTSSGRALRDVRGTHPKIVGGVDAESTRAAALVYDAVVDNEVVPVSDATTAEAVKVFEGLYRDVNIALANELARLTDELGADVREAIDAANTQPYCDIHTPGPGVGGHCIPYYPYFVLNWLDTDAPLTRTARAVNDGMPTFVVDRVAEGLGAAGIDLPAATVLVCGLAYRAGVAETRASPAHGVCTGLSDLGATVLATDPIVEVEGFDAHGVDHGALPLSEFDAVVYLTDHEAFDAVDWDGLPEGCVVVDGRDALDPAVGTHHYTVGRGWR